MFPMVYGTFGQIIRKIFPNFMQGLYFLIPILESSTSDKTLLLKFYCTFINLNINKP